MKRLTVKTKLTLWNVGVLAFALAGLGIAIFTSARAHLLQSVDKEMRSRADRQVRTIARIFADPEALRRGILIVGVAKGSNPKVIFPGMGPIATFDRGGGEFETVPNSPPPPSNDPARAQFRPRNLSLDGVTMGGEKPYSVAAFQGGKQGKESFTDVTIDNEPVRILTLPVHINGKVERVLQYPQPLSGTYQALNGLTLTLITAIPIILLIAALGGVLLTGRALQPVRAITDTASHIGEENLDERLEVRGNDEFSRLSQTVNGMLERLQGAFRRMEHAVEQQRRFTADASHELRTPLTVIKANTSLAMRGTRTPEEYKKTLAAVDHATDTMGRLVNDLLLLARSDTGRLELQMEPVNLKDVLCEAVGSVERPGVAPITVDVAEVGQVIGDEHSLVRVFVNLLENAARHTPESGNISVRASSERGDAVISVRDTGAGIPEEHLPHLCDRFYRVDKSRTSGQGGNGLGLAICASILEGHKGNLVIASTEGEGTTVTVRLPLVT